MQYVNVGRRLLAAMVDGAIAFFGFGFAIAALTSKASLQPNGGVEFQLEGGPALALFALGFMYFVVLEATLGATVGKFVVGVRVRTMAGGRIGWAASLVRNLLRAVDVCVFCVGALLILTSPRRQRLGDCVAGTVVLSS
jgi:uncharacterized RDD family membrane protein YckC